MSDVPDPLDDQDPLEHRPIRKRVAAPGLQPPAFTCPVCHRSSWNRYDAQYGYCDACHEFTGQAQPPLIEPGGSNGPSHAP